MNRRAFLAFLAALVPSGWLKKKPKACESFKIPMRFPTGSGIEVRPDGSWRIMNWNGATLTGVQVDHSGVGYTQKPTVTFSRG